MKAILIPVEGKAEIIEIDNELEALQKAVGGYIETVTIAKDCCLIVDEEGLLKQYKRNDLASIICGGHIYGPALIVGVDGEEFDDVPQQYIDAYMIEI